MKMITLTIPGMPPTVNSYVRHSRGRHFKTSEATKFQSDIAILAAGRSLDCGKKTRYAVEIHITLGPKAKGDLDNFCKVCLDGLVIAKVIRSDAAIDLMTVSKSRGEVSETRITAAEI